MQGNFLGIDVSGTVALPNAINANGTAGVRIEGVNNNLIGGAAIAARNVISGNANMGIFMVGTTGDQVAGNFIGTTASGGRCSEEQRKRRVVGAQRVEQLHRRDGSGNGQRHLWKRRMALTWEMLAAPKT